MPRRRGNSGRMLKLPQGSGSRGKGANNKHGKFSGQRNGRPISRPWPGTSQEREPSGRRSNGVQVRPVTKRAGSSRLESGVKSGDKTVTGSVHVVDRATGSAVSIRTWQLHLRMTVLYLVEATRART